MATDPRCVVEVGVHPGPYWLGNGRPFCDRHKRQMQERDDLNDLTWESVEYVPRDGYDYPTTLRPLCEGAPERGLAALIASREPEEET